MPLIAGALVRVSVPLEVMFLNVLVLVPATMPVPANTTPPVVVPLASNVPLLVKLPPLAIVKLDVPAIVSIPPLSMVIEPALAETPVGIVGELSTVAADGIVTLEPGPGTDPEHQFLKSFQLVLF